MLIVGWLREVPPGARLERSTLIGIQVECVRQVFDSARIREATQSALEISDTTCTESRTLRQRGLRQTGALPKFSKKPSKRPPTLVVPHRPMASIARRRCTAASRQPHRDSAREVRWGVARQDDGVDGLAR
jgi:hypothetical protein